MFKAAFDRWFKRTRLNPRHVGLLAMPFHIGGKPFVVIPLVGQFGCQESNYISSLASAFIYTKLRHRDIRLYGAPIRLCYSDDTAGFIPERLYTQDDLCFTTIAEQHAGTNAAPITKKSIKLVQTTVGAMYDLTNSTIGLSEPTFLKLVNVLFNELPETIVPGKTRITVKQFQRIGPYMWLASSYIPMLKPFTHAIYENIAGYTTSTTALISDRTAIDIAFWRATLFATCTSIQWLSVPINIPPLVTRHKDQCKVDFAHYQAANSHIIIDTDASTGTILSPTWGGGWTAHLIDQPTSHWGMYEPPTFATFLQSYQPPPPPELLATLDQINLYEAITVVLACDAILHSLPPDRQDHITLFVWCDNTSAIAWLTTNKSNHPTINFLLQVWARLQANHNCTINCGHIPGKSNIIPDAISRQFQVPNGSSIRDSLSRLTPHQSLPNWLESMLTCSNMPSPSAWQIAHEVLMALDNEL